MSDADDDSTRMDADGDDEEYEYDDDMDYDYEDEDNENVPVSGQKNITSSGKDFSAATLMRENSSGGYYLQIPSDSYIIQPGVESSILPLLDGLRSEVSSLCGISMDEALALLHRLSYNKERAIGRYMDQGETFRREAAIDLYDNELISKQLYPSMILDEDTSADAEPLCEICYDSIRTPADGFQLGCHHLYCRDCYTGHIVAKINDGPVCITMECPAPKCKQWIPYSAVKVLLSSSHADQVARYEQFLVANFIEKTQFFRYCPGKNCGRVAVGSGISKVHCHCGLDFCFHCGEVAHDPCSCDQLKRWTLKGNDENENLIWIMANTQRCPNLKCDYPIEKNNGCNHMTCSRCRHEFCWICLRDWRNHGGSFYECNRYKEEASLKDAIGERERARKESNRYLHYFRRYQLHQDSGNHAKTLLEKYITDYEIYLDENPGLTTDQSDRFLIDTCQQLIDCRRALMNTYIMGFYLKEDSPDKELFEHQQALLEEGTDLLQELAKSSSASKKKEEIIRRTQVVNGFFKRMTSSFAGGVVHSFDLTL